MQPTIDLKLFGSLIKHTPTNNTQFPITSGITVAELIDQLQISMEKARLIFINGLRAQLDTHLHGNEEVRIFPPVVGG